MNLSDFYSAVDDLRDIEFRARGVLEPLLNDLLDSEVAFAAVDKAAAGNPETTAAVTRAAAALGATLACLRAAVAKPLRRPTAPGTTANGLRSQGSTETKTTPATHAAAVEAHQAAATKGAK